MSTKRAVLIAKDCQLLSNHNQSNFGSNSLNNGFRNYDSINLNQFQAATKVLNQFDSKSKNSNQNHNGFGNVNDYETTKKEASSWQKNNVLKTPISSLQNYHHLQKEYQTSKIVAADKNLNKSTLSLHIEAYENDAIKIQNNNNNVDTKKVVIGDDLKASTKTMMDKFGFPRQQQQQKEEEEEELMEAEVMAFSLSKRMMNPYGMKNNPSSATQKRVNVLLQQYRKKSDEIADSFHIIPMGKSDVSMQTRISFLTKDMNDQKLLGIRGYSSVGFRLMDDTFLYGPIAAFPKTCLSWRILSPADITPESLTLFFMLQPKIDILIVGVGERKDLDKIRKTIAPLCKEHKIGLEIMPTEDAIFTFNYLNSEMRYVAAALFPPRDLHVTDYQYGRALSYLQSWDEIDEHPLLSGLTNNFNDPAHDIVKRLWGEYQPGIVSEIKRISGKRLEEKAEHIREGIKKEPKHLPADDKKNKLNDK